MWLILEGLDTSVQLLQGPPGTGKTQTTAVSALVRTAVPGLPAGSIVVIAAPTHTAVDNLLTRTAEIEGSVRAAAIKAGMTIPAVTLAKVHSSDAETPLQPVGRDWQAHACANDLSRSRKAGVAIVGGTTGALLKMAETLGGTAAFRNGGF